MTKKELAVPKGLSITPSLFEQAKKKADALGLSFSQLITILIKKDLEEEGKSITIKAQTEDGYDEW